jgi:hypothetical protein
MRLSDPFPIPGRAAPTHAIAWDAIACSIVPDRLKVERNERSFSAPTPITAARCSTPSAPNCSGRAIELATILNWTPALTALRDPDGCKPDPADARAEDGAMLDLFECADIYIWLQSDWRSKHSTYAIGQSEGVLAQWQGRGLHFHWFHDPQDPDPESR